MKLSFLILISFIILFFPITTFGQSLDKNMKSDDVTDEQVALIKARMTAEGMSVADFKAQALAAGASPSEVAKISARLSQNTADSTKSVNKTSVYSPRTVVNKASFDKEDSVRLAKKSNIFGAELFNNPAISFEPNQNMPTPKNYILSTGDQLIIDIYGYSEGTYKLSVSPEGNIRIPNVGPVSVNGLTIEQAKSRISDHLARHGFSNIKSGNTSVNITLGNIRSIKVTLIGEVNAPGTYTMSSLSSVYTALYASGGPAENGSYRDIQLIRDNKVISTIDVYDFLMNGDKSGDIILKDQDIIKINPYKNRVSLNGEVKRKLIFEAIGSDNLLNMLEYAGGFTSEAYKRTINITRNTEREREIVDVDISEFATFKPANGDSCTIGKILDRYTNRVSITGFVFRPGAYSLTAGMTVADLIHKADGVREDAYLLKSTLFRKGEDLSPIIQSLNLQKVLKGEDDFVLQKEDSLVVFSKFATKELFLVSIRGEVISPGSFPFSENMRLKDLIYLAGGLKESASQEIEISRRIKDVNVMDRNAVTANVISYKLLSDIESDTLILRPFDEVTLKPIPGYKAQANVIVKGEVVYPGSYVLQIKEERISSLIKRSGGFTASAYQPGAVLIRNNSKLITQELKSQMSLSTLQKTSKVSDSLITKTITEINKSNYVGIDLEKALKNPGSNWDVILQEGDILSVPTQIQTVKINGQVLFPSEIIYSSGKSLKSYITSSGGFAQNANRKRVFVVNANGTVKGTSTFLGIHNYPDVTQGADIYVPAKEKNTGVNAATAGIIISALTAISTIVVLIISL